MQPLHIGRHNLVLRNTRRIFETQNQQASLRHHGSKIVADWFDIDSMHLADRWYFFGQVMCRENRDPNQDLQDL